MRWMGIDGGGSNLRVVIVDDEMNIHATARRGTVNPSIIGREASAALIQEAMREVVAQVSEPLAGVGIGIAGASAVYAREWLQSVIHAVLSDVYVAAASDNEIALVGAHGTHEGILLLAGTGSVTLAIDAMGQSVQVGGWGYLLGDEGSGYWIGMQALQAASKAWDGQLQQTTSLQQRVMDELHLQAAADLLQWLYGQQPTPVAAVAKLSQLVLDEATAGDAIALSIIRAAADHLAHLVETAKRQLQITEARIAFAGGLLETENILSAQVRAKFGLKQHPPTLYPPLVGAALLAKITYTPKT